MCGGLVTIKSEVEGGVHCASDPFSHVTDTELCVVGFYLHGADRRSRHSDSLALDKQAGRCRG